MTPDELQQRTREFALRIIKLVDALPKSAAGRGMGTQLLRSGTSVAANYRAARCARSHKEFLAKIGIVAEESDEAELWLDLIMASNMISMRRVKSLHAEAAELMKIFAASRRSARVRQSKSAAARRSTKAALPQSPNGQLAKWPNREFVTT